MADKTKRQNKKIDRIQKRLDNGMKSKRQAGRNLDRLEKITTKASRADDFKTFNKATTAADQALDQYANFEDSSPVQKTSPFYKTGQAKSPLFKHVPGHVSKRAAPMEPGSDESFLGEGKGGYLQDRPMTNPTGAPEGSDSYYTGGEGGYLQGKPMNTSIIKGVPNASSFKKSKKESVKSYKKQDAETQQYFSSLRNQKKN